MRVLLVLLAFMICLSFPALASDGEVLGCGVPQTVDIETDPGFSFCDVYTRQLAYKQKRLKFRQQLEERQANFAAPRRRARENYAKAVIALHEKELEEALAAQEDSENIEPVINDTAE